jgi:prepilin-type N-terminal cleavage/methylation domain-containing protein
MRISNATKICSVPARDRYRRSSRTRGFTLIELLAVVALIALLATTSARICYGTYKRMLAEKGAKGVYLSAKYARLLAVERQMQCRLVLDKESRSYCLVLGNASLDEDEVSSPQRIQDSYVKPTQFGGEVNFGDITILPSYQEETEVGSEQDGYAIVFYPDGTADTASVSIGDGTHQYAVYVTATGKAHVRFGEATEVPVAVVDLDMEDL